MLEAERVAECVTSLGIAPSEDGYLRLALRQLRAVPLVHLISGLDIDPGDEQPESVGAMLSVIAGYTEWTSLTTPAISVGWDWLLHVADREIRYLRMGEPRSNIMLLDHYQRDLGPMQTAVALALLVDELVWQVTVSEYVRTRYT
jgi:Domain of unknown function (DUF4902)